MRCTYQDMQPYDGRGPRSMLARSRSIIMASYTRPDPVAVSWLYKLAVKRWKHRVGAIKSSEQASGWIFVNPNDFHLFVRSVVAIEKACPTHTARHS
jgi:hypothetical protein